MGFDAAAVKRLERHAARRYECLDLHCEGMAARVVVSGLPNYMYELERFTSVFEARRHFIAELDSVRETLMKEPRGYHCTNLDFVVPSRSAVHGLIIAEHNAVYPLMSGHNTICTVTALVEGGLLTNSNHISLRPGVSCTKHPGANMFDVMFSLETPGGIIEILAVTNTDLCAFAAETKLKCISVQFRNVPAFFAQSVDIKCKQKYFDLGLAGDGLKFFSGKDAVVKADIAFGGMFYCIVDVAQFGENRLSILPENGAYISRFGEMLKVACREQFPVEHPVLEGYPGPDIMVFTEFNQESQQRRNAVVMSLCPLEW